MADSSRGTPGAAVLVIAAALSAACASPAPRTHTVEIRGFVYVPATLEVAAGDTVVWINRDAVPHTATSDGDTWDSGNVGAEQSWRLVIQGSPATQPYYCEYHPNMRGAVVVN